MINNVIIINTTTPELILNRNYTSIGYHICREAQAVVIFQITKEGTLKNWLT